MAAWSVHLLTALGAVAGLLALDAATRQQWRVALAWMVAAVMVDALDGTLARLARVGGRLPRFDGALLDNIVDYLNYVFVPAYLILRAELVPAGAELIASAAVLLSSAYQFCQGDAKTHDHFFKGFPSYWNVVVLYLLALGLPPSVNLAVVLVLAALVFVPVHWAYPSRMLRLRELTLALSVLWGAGVIAIVWLWPDAPRWLVVGSTIYLAYYAAVSVYLSMLREA